MVGTVVDETASIISESLEKSTAASEAWGRKLPEVGLGVTVQGSEF